MVRPKIRRRAAPRLEWASARKLVQILVLAGFVVLVIGVHTGAWPPSTADLPFRLDPLVILSQTLASRTFLISSSLAVSVILLALLFGRAWCGWLCPMGTVLDLIPLRRKNRVKEPQPVPESWRKVKYLLLFAILAAALLTNLTLLFLDPITLFFRALTISILPSLDISFTAVENALGSVPFLQEPLYALDSLLRPAVLPVTPSAYTYAFIYGALFLAIIGLNHFAHRFWCRYLCPLGAFLGLISRAALIRRQVTGDCQDCNLCVRDCPVGTIRADRGYASDPAECTVCMDCLGSCRLSGNTFKPILKLGERYEYDPRRREVLESLGVSLAAVVFARSAPLPVRVNPHYIQPPGAIDNLLLEKCIRCGECIRVCPTSGLQPAGFEAGLDGVVTPVLVPRIGYCDYSCNACGQICPVEAIPPLSLEEKRTTVIGSAYINQNRCIAWADHQSCIVCQEMCPLPEKAVYLIPGAFSDPHGNPIEVKLPYVNRSACIGCGICETKCPVRGEAAIRVYTAGSPDEQAS